MLGSWEFVDYSRTIPWNERNNTAPTFTTHPRPIPSLPIQASPFQNNPNWSCISAHVGRYRASLVSGPGATVDSIPGNMYSRLALQTRQILRSSHEKFTTGKNEPVDGQQDSVTLKFSRASCTDSCSNGAVSDPVVVGKTVTAVFEDSGRKDGASPDSFVLRASSTKPGPPRTLLFCGGSGFTLMSRGASAPLARNTTSRQRLQSSSSS